MARCFYYPSGHVSVTEAEMYASPRAERDWAAIGFICGLQMLRG